MKILDNAAERKMILASKNLTKILRWEQHSEDMSLSIDAAVRFTINLKQKYCISLRL